jgi:S-adenosylmethionine:tRNA ribosyltransferase-isomerase
LKTADFDYELPPENIAQKPAEPRHASRLLVLDRKQTGYQHKTFWDICDYLRPGDVLVVNQTRVIPARLFGHKDSGGKVEVLLLRRHDALTWEALIGGKRMVAGRKIQIINGPQAEVCEVLEGSRRLVRFSEPVENYLQIAGQMPLPPYIHTPLTDPERYQTIYAKQAGSAAAPTAGLHFTPELFEKIKNMGVRVAQVTLHVGLDTFAPVTEEDPTQHQIHTEWCEVTEEAAAVINQAHQNGGRVIAVGTTSVRTLESAGRAAPEGVLVGAFTGPTDLFILPGYTFKVVEAIITNFHLPRSSLIMLISAFSGREKIIQTYQEAIRLGYRFYSFGDAMLIL